MNDESISARRLLRAGGSAFQTAKLCIAGACLFVAYRQLVAYYWGAQIGPEGIRVSILVPLLIVAMIFSRIAKQKSNRLRKLLATEIGDLPADVRMLCTMAEQTNDEAIICFALDYLRYQQVMIAIFGYGMAVAVSLLINYI